MFIRDIGLVEIGAGASDNVGASAVDQCQGPALGQSHAFDTLLQLGRFKGGEHDVRRLAVAYARHDDDDTRRAGKWVKKYVANLRQSSLDGERYGIAVPVDGRQGGKRFSKRGAGTEADLARRVGEDHMAVEGVFEVLRFGVQVGPVVGGVGQRGIGQYAQRADTGIEVVVHGQRVVAGEVSAFTSLRGILLRQAVPGQPERQEQQRHHAQPDELYEEGRQRPRFHGALSASSESAKARS